MPPVKAVGMVSIMDEASIYSTITHPDQCPGWIDHVAGVRREIKTPALVHVLHELALCAASSCTVSPRNGCRPGKESAKDYGRQPSTGRETIGGAG